mmetsp:Transcript_48452/g.35660  ORF Transcript_48452/g.35660 Transcript_48452/m.35660 type:complete len:113 (-) Transcript_48452:28-366(-)
MKKLPEGVHSYQSKIKALNSKGKCRKHKKVLTTVHGHKLRRRRKFMEPWTCSAHSMEAPPSQGCFSPSPNFLPGMGTKLWVCKECSFLLCKLCVVKYGEAFNSDATDGSQSD